MKAIDCRRVDESFGKTEMNERLCTPQNYGADVWHKLHNHRARQRLPANAELPPIVSLPVKKPGR